MSAPSETAPEPRPPALLLAALVLALLALVAVPLADRAPEPAIDRLAAGHPHVAVFEVAAGVPPAQALQTLSDWPELGALHTGSGPAWRGTAGETRILAHPDGPVAAETLEAIGRAVLADADLRWLTAPSQRTWTEAHDRVRAGLAIGGVLLGLAALASRTRPELWLAAAAWTAALSWWDGPLHPVVAATLPLAVVLGRAAGRHPVLAVLATLVPQVTGHPVMAEAGFLLLVAAIPAAVRAAFRVEEPPHSGAMRGSPWPGRTLVGALLAVGVLTALAPTAPPRDLLARVPRTATVTVPEGSDPTPAIEALAAHGLGTLDGAALTDPRDAVLAEQARRHGAALAVPLVHPWVEPALQDTLAAAVPEARWSGPRTVPADPPWVALGLFAGLLAVVALVRARTPSEATATLLPAAALVPALLFGVASSDPATQALVLVLAPAMAVIATAARTPVEAAAALAVPGLTWAVALPALGTPAVGVLLAAVLAGLAHAAAPAIVAEAWPSPPVRRWLPRLAFAGVLAVHVDVLSLLVNSFRPPGPGIPPEGDVVVAGPDRSLGPHRLHREHGVFVLYTEGAPYETGFAAGRLADDLRVRLEDELFDAFERNVPYSAARWLISRGSAAVGRSLDGALRESHREELRGDVDAAPERYVFGGPSYTRKVYYHAIHDIGQALVDTPLLGCTGFVAGPPTTPDGHWRLARAFDFDGGVAFDRDKVVRVHRPDDGIPFMSVSFAGIVGAVSGVNADGIAVVINAGGSDDPPRPGTPMTLIVREILQHATSLEDVARILDERTGFVSENVLVVDADAGEAALFEVSPARVERTDVGASGWMAMSNHFRSPGFANDATNARRMEELTTVPRLERAEELVREGAGGIDMFAAAAMLSDRRGLEANELPRGHRHALNADIATHGVVIDATTRSLWVSAYPNLSGGWVSLSLEDALAGDLSPVPQKAADPDAWRAVEIRQARELLRAVRRSSGPRALTLARRAYALWPDHPEAQLERGLLEIAHGDPAVGRALLESAREAPLEYARQIRQAEEALGARP